MSTTESNPLNSLPCGRTNQGHELLGGIEQISNASDWKS